MEHIRVALSERSYDIEIGAGNLDRIGPFLASPGVVRHVILITDENVYDPYARRVAGSLAENEISTDILTVKAGENSKSIETAFTLWEMMLEDGADRNTVVVAVGGGVVGDLAGFVASSFARGLRFFQVPTTLLAQVDSSVGGKVGINLPNAKNMVGAFHQPIGVLIDTETLSTLDELQYKSGLGEVVKYAVSLDSNLFEALESDPEKILSREHERLRQIIARCCALKAAIVAKDERETTGLRALLNFGHTFAHAFETLSGFALLHGLAVSIGSVYAVRLAEKLNRIDSGTLERIVSLYKKLSLPVSIADIPKLIDKEISFDAEEILEAMRRDKKTTEGEIRFVLPSSLGRCELCKDVKLSMVRDILMET